MGPQDHLRALHDGTSCTVCDEPVPVDRVRLLATRDDLAFVEVSCPACGSTGLGFVAQPPESGAGRDAAADRVDMPGRPGRVIAPEAVRLAGALPISADDVLDMHAALAGWTGDLVGLLTGPDMDGRPGDRGAGGGRARGGGRRQRPARSSGRSA